MESFSNVLPWIQIILSVILVIAILLQQSGTGLGGALGGSDSVTYRTKRGSEKFLFNLTLVLGVLFIALSVAQILL
jgi:preprotein translocase subunit SecG